MEDTQNSAPDAPSMHETSKLGTTTRRTDTQSVTKRFVSEFPVSYSVTGECVIAPGVKVALVVEQHSEANELNTDADPAI
jgi:hypothetical protein